MTYRGRNDGEGHQFEGWQNRQGVLPYSCCGTPGLTWSTFGRRADEGPPGRVASAADNLFSLSGTHSPPLVDRASGVSLCGCDIVRGCISYGTFQPNLSEDSQWRNVMSHEWIPLDCGREVSFDAFHYSVTYSGLLEGRPTKKMNARICESALDRAGSMWGKRKVHMVPPKTNEKDPDHPRLPEVEITVWLTCNDPIDPSFDGSELVAVFYRDEWKDESLYDVIHGGVRSIPWDELAYDFYW